MNNFHKKSELHEHLLKQTRMVFNAQVVANATPASKSHVVDIPGCTILRTQGKTAEADAVEDVSAQVSATANDATGICAILVDLQVKQIYKLTVTPSVGTATSSTSITTGKRALINLDSNQDLSAVSVTFMCELEVKEASGN